MEKKKQIIEDYNSSARIYDSRYVDIQNYKFKLFFDKIKINRGLFLDAGSGTNLLQEYIEFRKLSNKIKLICLDISLGMLKVAKKKFKDSNLILGDLEHLPLRSRVFNGIFSITSLQNLSDIDKGIKEISCVMSPNALIAISALGKNIEFRELKKIIQENFTLINFIIDDSCEDWLFYRNEFEN